MVIDGAHGRVAFACRSDPVLQQLVSNQLKHARKHPKTTPQLQRSLGAERIDSEEAPGRPGSKTAAHVPAMAPLGAAVEDYCQPLAYYVSCYFKCYKHNRVYLNKLSGSQLKKKSL